MKQLQKLSSELHRITSYTTIMAQLAQDGSHTALDTAQLQQVFADIASVTGTAFAEIEMIIANDIALQA